MPARITLIKKGTDPNELPGGLQRHSWPLVVEASGNLIPSEIFVWHAAVSLDVVPADVFEAVASVHQLETLPTEHRRIKSGGEVDVFYRTRRLELACRSAEEAARVWKIIQADVRQLVLNWNLAATLVTENVFDTAGETPTVTTVEPEPLEETPVQISDFVFDERLTGLVDNVNRVYRIANPAAPNTLQVFRNGVRVFGEGEDYEQAGVVITFSDPPNNGSRLTANYILAP